MIKLGGSVVLESNPALDKLLQGLSALKEKDKQVYDELFFLLLLLRVEKQDGRKLVWILVTLASGGEKERQEFKWLPWANYLVEAAEEMIICCSDPQDEEEFPSWLNDRGFGQLVNKISSSDQQAEHFLQATMRRMLSLLESSEWDAVYHMMEEHNVSYRRVLAFFKPVCSVSSIKLYSFEE